MDRPGGCLRQMRFELPQFRPRKHRIVDAVFLELMRVRDALEQRLLRAAAVEPTSMGHEALSRAADLGNQRVVLFLRCFLCLFHCRTIRRETRVVIGRGHIMKMPNPIGNDDFRRTIS